MELCPSLDPVRMVNLTAFDTYVLPAVFVYQDLVHAVV